MCLATDGRKMGMSCYMNWRLKVATDKSKDIEFSLKKKINNFQGGNWYPGDDPFELTEENVSSKFKVRIVLRAKTLYGSFKSQECCLNFEQEHP